MDAITLLKNDHRTVEQLFKRFEKAGDGAHAEKRDIVARIIEELSVHAVIEEQIFYPFTRATVPETEDIALESLEEHHIVKWVLSELDGMDPEHERFEAKVSVLMENVRHHVEEEEQEYFPQVRSALNRRVLDDLGDAMAEAKDSAPTHPHPRAPDTPPANAVVGAVAGVVDRVGDNLNELRQSGMSAVQDLIKRIMGSDPPPPRPSTARRSPSRSTKSSSRPAKKAASTAKKAGANTAKKAASATKRATAPAKRAASSAKKAGASTAKKAASATKRATSAAKKSAPTKKATAKKAPAKKATAKRATAKKSASSVTKSSSR